MRMQRKQVRIAWELRGYRTYKRFMWREHSSGAIRNLSVHNAQQTGLGGSH